MLFATRAARILTQILVVIFYASFAYSDAEKSLPCILDLQLIGGNQTLRLEYKKIFDQMTTYTDRLSSLMRRSEGGQKLALPPAKEVNALFGLQKESSLIFVDASPAQVAKHNELIDEIDYHKALSRGEVVLAGFHDYQDHAPGFLRISLSPASEKSKSLLRRSIELRIDPGLTKELQLKADTFRRDVAWALEVSSGGISSVDSALVRKIAKNKQDQAASHLSDAAYETTFRAKKNQEEIDLSIKNRALMIERLEEQINQLESEFNSTFGG